MTETQQRFLRAIAERVPMNQVVELHLFPPIRQGGVETGVAVVAEDPRLPAPNVDPEPAVAAVEAPLLVAEVETPVLVDEVEVPVTVAEVEAEPVTDGSASGTVGDYVVAIAEDTPSAEAVVAEELEPGGDPEVATEAADAGDQENGETTPVPAAPVARYTIHTARYRLTLKGVDRGKWEVDVVAEADAPLEAVDAVVRGVQRRAGEGAEPDRLNAEAFRGALEAPLATLER